MVTEASAIATADPARISRVGPVRPPAESAITSPAAASPPTKAKSPEDSTGSVSPNAAAATTARCAPALTARVSGEASGLRASDWKAAPAMPRARPTESPASMRGRREATRIRATSSLPLPKARPIRSEAPMPDVPWVRWAAAITITAATPTQKAAIIRLKP